MITKRFTDLSDARRMELRAGIEATGADCIEYLSDGRIQIALPADHPMTAVYKIESLGFRECGGHYFPLGTDKPLTSLRHFGPGTHAAPKGDKPSYWLYWTFKLYVHPELQVEIELPELCK